MDAHYIQSKSLQSSTNHRMQIRSKPIMIYYFLDPLCNECWLTESHIKKMIIEYGPYIQIRPVISHIFNECHTSEKLIRSPKIDLWNKYYVLISIKAATLQGNRAGQEYLRHIQQSIILHYEQLQISNRLLLDRLIDQAAKKANLDIIEFYYDLASDVAKKALRSDLHLKNEMDVQQYPTFVFFSKYIDEYGIKVSGIQPYETYEYILREMMQSDLLEQNKPSLIETFQYFKRLLTEEIAFIYDYPLKEAERQIKKLQLKQMVKKIEVNGFDLWEYCG